jgi:tetratricopeptide (TPR) repeat protein
MLFAGDFSFTTTPELAFVGGSAGPNASKAFGQAVRDIGSYYAQLLGIPYDERPTLLTFLAVSSDRRPGIADWQFVTWPTIAMSGGISFESALVIEGGVPVVPRPLWTTLSHEMGHYYFGTKVIPVGPLRWVILESMAEYLSLKAISALRGSVAGTARLIEVVQNMGTTTLPSLDRITREDQVTGTYRYNYAPAFFALLEKQYGEAKLAAWLRELLALPSSTSFDFETVARAAERAGLPRTALTQAFDADSIRRGHVAKAYEVLDDAVRDRTKHGEAVTIMTALVNIDSATTARLQLLPHLQRIVKADSTRLDALYQIGRIGALTGRELATSRAALERYVRFPAAPGAPTHAAAYWRMGMIEEHDHHVDQARAAYRRALALDPAHVQAKDALARLDRG